MSKSLLVTLLVVLVSLLVAEVVARTVFGLAPLELRNPYQPIFALAEFDYRSTNEEIARGPAGPPGYGYDEGMFGYYYTGRTAPPRSDTVLADFLFNHSLSRYSARDIERIACEQPQALGVFVLGASVAQGHSARRKDATWHAILERLMRKELGRDDVYVFNGAMGGYLSLQDKLAYYLALVPRQVHAVLFLNSYNDLMLPVHSATRPGDPFVLGVRFTQFFGDGFLFWLAKHSGIVNAVVQAEAKRAVSAYAQRLETDDKAFARYAEAVTDMYLQNMGEVLADCQTQGRFCLVAVPPTRPFTSLNTGKPAGELLSDARLRTLYELLMKKVGASPHHADFLDLTHMLDAPGLIDRFTDSVHIDEDGQRLLAEQLLGRVLDGVRSHQSIRAPGASNCR